MSFKFILRRLVMAFVLGGYSVWGVGMSREEVESLMHAMNQSNIELPMLNDDGDGDPKGKCTECSGVHSVGRFTNGWGDH